ncbi:hypothetical protein GIB67_011738 [Kingdonia uniflora]|uniref:galactinol--sucrose galactosyltransferase n=1 Tax=Kingdonia uniflora TaxID=39325 RepID=A0A7J7LUD3_9MAGN|nr:hypothetical protein GIB67_011738 [Kingdonia uniflora]
MVIMATTPIIEDGVLTIRGKVVFRDVPTNIITFPASCGSAFIGATSNTSSSRHIFTLGILEGYRLLCFFRFRLWWMIPRFGTSASEIPVETQMLLLEVRDNFTPAENYIGNTLIEDTFYILILPVLDGKFRASLRGSSTNELQFCVESGDPNVESSQALEAVFVNSGENPFELMRESIKYMPATLDWFGWCTWDAFYTEVNPQGIKEGLESLSEGGCPARFLIIDDGWQDTVNEYHKEGKPLFEGIHIFRSDIDPPHLIHSDFIKSIKGKYGLKYIYAWHALVGYWGGLLPNSETLKKYNPEIKYPVLSPDYAGNLSEIIMDTLEKYGVGIINPSKIHEFYNDLPGYLANIGIDGVKVDAQNLIETLGSGYDGRISLSRQYQLALEESIANNFKDNSIICCMCHNMESIYSSRKSVVARASEDFMPREPTFQTLHICSVAFNSLFLGEIFVPDWDMFHSYHATAEFHGAARALSGCGVYVSDKPGIHDFLILKRLVLPDGSILRARYAGRPNRDCLFVDPVMDGKSLLKIWNLNKLGGVIGVFNCQGSGSWPCKERNPSEHVLEPKPSALSSSVRPVDVEFLQEVAGENWAGDCAVYAFKAEGAHNASGRPSRTGPCPHRLKTCTVPHRRFCGAAASAVAVAVVVAVVVAAAAAVNVAMVVGVAVVAIAPTAVAVAAVMVAAVPAGLALRLVLGLVQGWKPGTLSRLPKNGSIEVTLGVLHCEIYTISPIRVYNQTIHFAPIGLVDMYNSGGAIEALNCSEDSSTCKLQIKVRGCGCLGAYSSKNPKYSTVNKEDKEFNYDAENGLLSLNLPAYSQGECKVFEIEIVY